MIYDKIMGFFGRSGHRKNRSVLERKAVDGELREGAVPTYLDELVEQLGGRLGNPPSGDARSLWAFDLCVLTREIHVEVWDAEPDRMFVQNRIIPLFVKVGAAVRDVPPSGESHTSDYADNVVDRTENLSRYVRGEKSAFDPAERNPSQTAGAH